jgi:hypothetical protein
MLLNSEFYDLTQAFQGALFQGGMALLPDGLPPPSNVLLQVRAGYAESPGWVMVQAKEFDPEPLSVERFRVRAVWSSKRIVAALLDLMASEKWFDRVGDDYHLTEDGRTVLQSMVERRQMLLTPLITHLSADEVEPLEQLMRRILDASLSTAEPPGKWSLIHSRKRAPDDNAPTVFKLFQYCADINACRDEAHMAAFQPLGVEAYVWEAFSHIWNGTANTAQAIYDALAYRGYSKTEFADGLQKLAARGWVSSDDDLHYQITIVGQKVRHEAEHLTDEYFFHPWICLSNSEIEELHSRLSELKTKLEGLGK